MSLRCFLWDFGDTLFDELSLWRLSPEWMEVYRSFDDPDGIGAAWNLGEVDVATVAAHVAAKTSMSEDQILRHLARADLFEPFPFTYEYFRARHLPQAIVTLNPTDFRVLAAKLTIDQVVETIVISADERSDDKGHLCELALDRMSKSYAPHEALLIDNKRVNVDSWVSRGGMGYHYKGDAAFKHDVERGLEGVCVRPR